MILTQKEVVPMPTKQTAAVDIFADKKKYPVGCQQKSDNNCFQ